MFVLYTGEQVLAINEDVYALIELAEREKEFNSFSIKKKDSELVGVRLLGDVFWRLKGGKNRPISMR